MAISEAVALKLIEVVGRVVGYGVLGYSAIRASNRFERGLKHVGDGTENGLKLMMSGRGSGGDHMETGLKEIAKSLRKQPLQVALPLK